MDFTLDVTKGIFINKNIVLSLPLSILYWCFIITFIPWFIPAMGN